MDILSIASQLMGATSKDTGLLSQFLDHPYSTTQQVTGADQMLSKTDMSQVLTALAAMTGGQQKAETLDTNSIATLASSLLGKSDNSIHGLTNLLFGTSQQATQVQQQQKSSGLDLGTLMSVAGIASTVLGGKKKKSTGVDLSDGIGLDDVLALAGGALSGNKKSGGVDLSDGIGLDDIAGLAAGLLGKK